MGFRDHPILKIALVLLGTGSLPEPQSDDFDQLSCLNGEVNDALSEDNREDEPADHLSLGLSILVVAAKDEDEAGYQEHGSLIEYLHAILKLFLEWLALY